MRLADEREVRIQLANSTGLMGPTGPQGPKGDRGERGEPGKDYVLTEADKREIAGMIEGGAGIDDSTIGSDTTYSSEKIENALSGLQETIDEKGDPTDTQVAAAVNTWLDAHPEATTTVSDGSITPQKLSGDVKKMISPVYSGFKAAFLGDSQTAINTCKTKPWWQWVVELLGIESYVNYGQNGATLTTLGKSATPICTRIESMDADVSLIFVMGGVNEFRTDTQSPFGSRSDVTPETIIGAVRYICRTLQNNYPKAPIVFITPTNQRLWTHKDGHTIADLAKTIYDACREEGVLCLDAQCALGVNPAAETVYTDDGLHLNDLGSELLGRWVARQVAQHIPMLGEEVPSDPADPEEPVDPDEPEEPVDPEEPDEPEVPEKTLTSLTAVYSGGAVSVGTDVSQLTGIVVTAGYSDGTSAAVTGYTLSGTIAEGENVITVAYGGLSTTFTVTGEEEGETVLIHVTDYEKLDGYVWNGGAVEMGAPGWYHTEMIPIPAGKELTLTIEARLNPIYYDASGNFISVGNYGSSLEQGDLTEVTSVSPENAAYIVLNLSPSTSDYSEVTISYKE